MLSAPLKIGFRTSLPLPQAQSDFSWDPLDGTNVSSSSARIPFDLETIFFESEFYVTRQNSN
jgi:hypothetical protein